MSASDGPAEQRIFELPSGVLELDIQHAEGNLDDLLGIAARANPRRGFLFVSKVLGKHWPSPPARMHAIHDRLAAGVPDDPGPVLFIAMAETAVGLGQGVYEAWLRKHPGSRALFLHTSRHPVDGAERRSFEEPHSHAPRQYLHLPTDPGLRRMLAQARQLVLMDDEISTGTTLVNLAAVCRHLAPQICRVHLLALADFVGARARLGLWQRFGVPTRTDTLIRGEYRFTPAAARTTPDGAMQFDRQAESGASTSFGRIGLDRALSLPADLAPRLAASMFPGASVLVLGTEEFMHPPMLLARALEAEGVIAMVQSSTRSPILPGGAVSHTLAFPDNYGEGVCNYLYNVERGQYDQVLVCHETPPNPALYAFARLLDARLLHFKSEQCVEEVRMMSEDSVEEVPVL